MNTSRNKVEMALSILKRQDWWWCFSDNSGAYRKACSSMREYVKTVASISDEVVSNALRELWIAKFECVSANMFHSDTIAKTTYAQTEKRLMKVIKAYVS